jgi:hypothetical protein
MPLSLAIILPPNFDGSPFLNFGRPRAGSTCPGDDVWLTSWVFLWSLRPFIPVALPSRLFDHCLVLTTRPCPLDGRVSHRTHVWKSLSYKMRETI